jgi:F-type H+-transporting ATPase subunit b
MLLLLIESSEGGFNPIGQSAAANMLWTWVIFILSLPFIWKIVMGPVTKALVARDQEASEAVKLAEKASEDAEKARAEVEVKLGEAQAEAAQVMAQARERAETREREIVEAAKSEATAMVESARTQIQAEQDKAISAIRGEVVELSINAASQVLSRRVDSDDDRRLVTELVSGSAKN